MNIEPMGTHACYCRASPPIELALELTIRTAPRTVEVINARWDAFDTERVTWVIPAQRMKMGEKHVVPLCDRTVEILGLARQFGSGGKFVFEGHSDRPLSNMAMLMAVRRMGHGDITVHGFRACFKTWAEENTEFDSLVIEAGMAHRVRGIERHYLRTTFVDKRRQLMGAWASFATGTTDTALSLDKKRA